MPEPKRIVSQSFCMSLSAMRDTLDKRVVDLSAKHIVLVPDNCTLAVEKMLCGNTGIMDIEVLTFNRLFHKMIKVDNFISKQGAIMLLRAVISSLSGQLHCYEKSAHFVGFAEKMYEIISQLQSSNVYPETLSQLPMDSTGMKLMDIKLIYEQYLVAIQGKYVDGDGRMQLLVEGIKTSEYLANAYVYIANYDSYTEKALSVIDSLSSRCHAVTIFDTQVVGETTFCGDLEIIEGTDTVDELKEIAIRIRNFIKGGGRYKDIAVVNSSVNTNSLERIFVENDIPYYIDKKRKLANEPIAELALTLIDLCVKGKRKSAMMSLAKNYYCNLTLQEELAFEDYCDRYNVEYNAFSEPFCYDGCDKAEPVRLKIMTALEPFLVSLKADFLGSLRSLLLSDYVAFLTEKLGKISGFPSDVSVGKLVELIEMLVDIVGGSVSIELLCMCLQSGIDSVEISYLPNYTDCVAVGAVGSFRGLSYERMFVMSFLSGSYPSVTIDSGAISDIEISELAELNINISPTVKSINMRAKSELMHLLSNAKNLTISYSISLGAKPPAVLSALKANAKTVKFSTSYYEEMQIASANESDAIRLIASRLVSKSAVVGSLARLISKQNNSHAIERFSGSIAKLSGDYFVKLLAKKDDVTSILDSENFMLFFPESSVSASKFESYFACPYSNFLSNALRLKERPKAEMRALDTGNLLHNVMERYVAKYTQNNGVIDTVGQATIIFEECVEREVIYLLAPNKPLIERLRNEAVALCCILEGQFKQSNYKIFGEEMAFGMRTGNQIKSPKLSYDGKEISLRGKIDRVDILGDYARVIDYKTGVKKFSFDEVFFGKSIQLPVYMNCMRLEGYQPSGLFYFPLLHQWGDDDFSHRLSGVYLDDVRSVCDMDTMIIENKKSTIIEGSVKVSKDGDISLGKSNLKLSPAEMIALCDYAQLLLENALKEIAEGNIAKSPIVKSGISACSYCNYKFVCDTSMAKPRLLRSNCKNNIMRIMGLSVSDTEEDE